LAGERTIMTSHSFRTVVTIARCIFQASVGSDNSDRVHRKRPTWAAAPYSSPRQVGKGPTRAEQRQHSAFQFLNIVDNPAAIEATMQPATRTVLAGNRLEGGPIYRYFGNPMMLRDASAWSVPHAAFNCN
jgi:hypothetical protein